MERRVAGAGGISSDQNRENSGAADKEIDFSYVDDLQLCKSKKYWCDYTYWFSIRLCVYNE